MQVISGPWRGCQETWNTGPNEVREDMPRKFLTERSGTRSGS